MNILAIDTTTKKANVGICVNGINKIDTVDNEITHSEKLLPLIDSVLQSTNITLKDIDVIACTNGPGSFTGIRIGLATAKALAKVNNAKIFAINSLELLANSTIDTNYKIIVPLINAKNTRAYYGIYKNTNRELIQIENLGNKYIKDILQELKEYCNLNNINILSEVLFVVDSDEIIPVLLEHNEYKYVLKNLDINLLISLSKKAHFYTTYLELDATYVRSSEAERTKYGE